MFAKPIEKQIYHEIYKAQEIVIARHIGPDPDAVASEIALRDSIKATFPDKKVYAVGSGFSRFKYLGELDKIDEDKLNNPLLIVVDVPNISRLDGVDFTKYKLAIKIDHHPKEDKMGIDYVDTTVSSASEMLANLIMNTRLKMTKNIAENLFLGIVSDSNRFLLSNSRTMQVVLKLIETYHINPHELYPKLYARPLNEIRFRGFIEDSLEVTSNGLAYKKITPQDISKYKVDTSTASNMINDFNYIDGIYVWIFITYDDKNDMYKVNIRSRGPIINEIASHYHGGGHKFASGVRTHNKEDIDRLLYELDEACKKYKEENK